MLECEIGRLETLEWNAVPHIDKGDVGELLQWEEGVQPVIRYDRGGAGDGSVLRKAVAAQHAYTQFAGRAGGARVEEQAVVLDGSVTVAPGVFVQRHNVAAVLVAIKNDPGNSGARRYSTNKQCQ